jgi:hypothetical protein
MRTPSRGGQHLAFPGEDRSPSRGPLHEESGKAIRAPRRTTMQDVPCEEEGEDDDGIHDACGG